MWMMCLMSTGGAISLNEKDGSCNDMLYCFGYFVVTFIWQNLSGTNSIDKDQPCQSSREQ